MSFMESSPSAGNLAVRPRCEAFAVARLYRQDLDTPGII